MTRTKLAVDMWKKSTMGNNRFNHMLVLVYRRLVPSPFNHVPSLSFLSMSCNMWPAGPCPGRSSLVPRPRRALTRREKGLVTIEQYLGCAESAVLLIGKLIRLQFSDIPRDIYCNATCVCNHCKGVYQEYSKVTTISLQGLKK